jgi:hypothetical protein
MNRFLLAIALVVACSAPVMADSGKTPSKAKQAHVKPTPKFKWNSEKARGSFDRDEVKDPYWEPCDYTTAWGPNPCGGS